MGLNRLARLLRARWVLLCASALVGVGIALVASDWWNRRIQPSYEATAAVTYLGTDTNSRDGSDPQLQALLNLALEANLENLGTGRGSITADEETSRLLFVASGPSGESAREAAVAMRETFSRADPSSEEPLIRDRLEEILTELENLDGETAVSVPGDSTSTEEEVITAQLDALRRLLADLAAQLALIPESPETEESRAGIEAEMATVGGRITELESQLTVPTTVPPLDREEQLQQGALAVYAQDLVDEYQTLFLRLLGRNPTTRNDAVTVVDQTPEGRPLFLMGGLGGLAGALLAAAALIMVDQALRPVWTRSDLDIGMPLRVELPPRSPYKRLGVPWYPTAPANPRKRGVQALRAGIDARIKGDPVSVGIVDLGAGPEQVATLTADLGAALATSGRNTLTIDADLEHGTRTRQRVPIEGASLAAVLAHQADDDEELQSFIKRALGDQAEVLPRLRSLPAGKVAEDVVDALSRKHFTMLLREAGSTFDVVMVSTPAFGDPATDGLLQRLDYVLFVTAAGRTRTSSIAQAERDLLARRSKLLGAALLVGRPVTSRPPRAVRRSTRQARRGPDRDSVVRRRAQEPQLAKGQLGFGRTAVRKTAKTVFAIADLFRGRFPGPRLLIYHQVGSERRREMNVPTKTFRRQLDWMERHGEVVTLDAALQRSGESRARRLFVLTFDDGYHDFYENAYPILLERQLPFTLYLSTDPVETGVSLNAGGDADPLTWEQVREMLSSRLMTIGSHGHQHLDFRTLELETIGEELDTSIRVIRERTGRTPHHFAYPYGYWSANAEQEVVHRFATAVLGGGPPVTVETNQHRIHRLPIQRSDGMFFFYRKMKRGMRLEELTRRRARGYKGVR